MEDWGSGHIPRLPDAGSAGYANVVPPPASFSLCSYKAPQDAFALHSLLLVLGLSSGHPPPTEMLRTSLRVRGATRILAPGSRAMSSLPSLPLTPPTPQEEAAQFEARIADMEEFFAQRRFASIKRPYTAAQVASKQGSMPILPLPSTLLANKLYALFEKAASEGKPVPTMGAIDPVQMTQMAPHQEVVYVSGWAASSVLTTGNNDVGPDLGCVRVDSPESRITEGPVHCAETTRTPQFRTKYTEYSGPNSCMTRSTMTSGGLRPQRLAQRCLTLTTCDPSLLTQTWGEHLLLERFSLA